MEKKNKHRSTIALVLDSAIFAAFLVATAPQFSGLAVHEWLGIAFAAAAISHLLLNWQWIAATTRRFLKGLRWQGRISYLLNVALFVDVTILIFTGLTISEVPLRSMGIVLPRQTIWRLVHSLAADLSIAIVGLHLALHWQWVVNTIKRPILKSLLPRQRVPEFGLDANPARKEPQL